MSAGADTEAAESTDRDVPGDLPPSAAHVLFVLRREGALSAPDLCSTSYLSESTTRSGVARLVFLESYEVGNDIRVLRHDQSSYEEVITDTETGGWETVPDEIDLTLYLNDAGAP